MFMDAPVDVATTAEPKVHVVRIQYCAPTVAEKFQPFTVRARFIVSLSFVCAATLPCCCALVSVGVEVVAKGKNRF
jgi:hypothetical protein